MYVNRRTKVVIGERMMRDVQISLCKKGIKQVPMSCVSCLYQILNHDEDHYEFKCYMLGEPIVDIYQPQCTTTDFLKYLMELL